MKEFQPQILAYYLPQFHPFPENDEWWGKGFTEWTNVGNAKPLFWGHYQPKVPADLGYYDLRIPEIRKQQVELAKAAGVMGFCYWHYWFGNKRQLLNEIIDEVIESGSPDFPFCFGWANESWKAKIWNNNGQGDRTLIEQTYGGELDYKEQFEYVLKAFKDKRYIKVDNKPVFLIYKPQLLPADFTGYWQKWAKENGFDGIYFIARIMSGDNTSDLEKKGLYVYTYERQAELFLRSSKIKQFFIKLISKARGSRVILDYKSCINSFTNEKEDIKENYIPSLLPCWDHSPRSKRNSFILHKCEPKYFYEHALKVLRLVKKKENKMIFLKSWNEWGEGNYMEPDLKYGKGYIEALSKAIKTVKQEE